MTRSIIVLLLSGFAYLATAQKAPQNSKKVIIKKERKRIDTFNDSIYYDRISQKKLDGMYIPRDLYDCFKVLNLKMSPEAMQTFMAYSDEEVDKMTHGTLGFWMEHKWSISEGSRLTEYFRKMGVPHYDYMIGVIIQSYHRYLHKTDLKVKEQVTRFQQLWAAKQQQKATEMLKTGKVQEKTTPNSPSN